MTWLERIALDWAIPCAATFTTLTLSAHEADVSGIRTRVAIAEIALGIALLAATVVVLRKRSLAIPATYLMATATVSVGLGIALLSPVPTVVIIVLFCLSPWAIAYVLLAMFRLVTSRTKTT